MNHYSPQKPLFLLRNLNGASKSTGQNTAEVSDVVLQALSLCTNICAPTEKAAANISRSLNNRVKPKYRKVNLKNFK